MERVAETGGAVLGVTEGLIAWQQSTRYASARGGCEQDVWMGMCGWMDGWVRVCVDGCGCVF